MVRPSLQYTYIFALLYFSKSVDHTTVSLPRTATPQNGSLLMLLCHKAASGGKNRPHLFTTIPPYHIPIRPLLATTNNPPSDPNRSPTQPFANTTLVGKIRPCG
jgi:hypothetical protein